MFSTGKRLAVFSIRESKAGSMWIRAGSAFVNRDGSLNVLLDVLPLDGRLHVRDANERAAIEPVTPTSASGTGTH